MARLVQRKRVQDVRQNKLHKTAPAKNVAGHNSRQDLFVSLAL